MPSPETGRPGSGGRGGGMGGALRHPVTAGEVVRGKSGADTSNLSGRTRPSRSGKGRGAGRAARRPGPAGRPHRPATGALPGSGGAAGRAWHAVSAGEAVRELGSDAAAGLSEAEASARLSRHGPNLLPQERPPSRLALVARQFESLPVLLLMGSAVVSIGTGGVADAVATLGVVAVNGVVGYVTEGQAERVIHGLMDSSRTDVRVLRGGAERQIRARDLVPGDLLCLAPGGQVAADARLVAAEGLKIDESVLTGESLAVPKRAGAEIAADTPLAERETMVHAGTLVSEGHGRAVVVATGTGTEAARTQMLSTAAIRPQAPVEAELDQLGRWLAYGSLAACGLFIAVGTLRGQALSVMLRDALALAVAAVPEGLPMVATSTLSFGLRRMEKRGILIRQMHVVESLGAMQTICLDKTGTLTQNRMAVVAAAAGTQDCAPDDAAALAAVAEVAALNNDAQVAEGRGTGASATETALIDLALGLGLDVAALREAHPRQETIERVPGRPWMATACAGTQARWLVKGAPEALLAGATHILEEGVTRPITDDDISRIKALNSRFAARPARVLAFARTDAEVSPDGLAGLTFLGLAAMTDPIRPEAPDFIRALHGAGIDTVLITGDQAATAVATARELGLARDGHLRVVDSADIGAMDPELLAGLARETHVFARVASHEKLAIVKALQAAGRVVAMTGDGVNDGPALNAADVGIAMGRSGADLARQVANVVIRDDELTTLLEAIAQGRAIYRNIRRALEFLVTTNISEIVVSIAEALHGPGELETPMELLWINMITDVLPGLGLALADPDEDQMRRPPRPPGETIIPRADAARMGRDSAVISASALAAHFVGMARHGPGPQTRSMTFLALSQGQLLYTLVCQRGDPRRLKLDTIFENRTLDLALLASCGLGLLPFASPLLRRTLGIAPIGAGDAAVAVAAALVPVGQVLARRGIELGVVEGEVRTCAIPS